MGDLELPPEMGVIMMVAVALVFVIIFGPFVVDFVALDVPVLPSI